MTSQRRASHRGIILLGLLFLISCEDPSRPSKAEVGFPLQEQQLCECRPTEVSKNDWRIAIKNVPFPENATPEEITVAEILRWQAGKTPRATDPRAEKELTLFRIKRAYLQSAFLREGDCDFHIEISEAPQREAPRVIVETPGVVKDFCPARREFFRELQQAGFTMTNLNHELPTPLPVEVIGLGFHDEWHPFWIRRGSARVATLWELHPAVVRVLR